MAAVLDHDSDRDLGIFDRRVGDEKCVVPELLVDLLLVVVLVLPDREYLGRAGLAGDPVFAAADAFGRAARGLSTTLVMPLRTSSQFCCSAFGIGCDVGGIGVISPVARDCR